MCGFKSIMILSNIPFPSFSPTLPHPSLPFNFYNETLSSYNFNNVVVVVFFFSFFQLSFSLFSSFFFLFFSSSPSFFFIQTEGETKIFLTTFSLSRQPQLLQLRQSEARRFFYISHVGAGSQDFGPSSTTFPHHNHRVGWEMEKPGHEPEPTQDPGACARSSRNFLMPLIYIFYCIKDI